MDFSKKLEMANAKSSEGLYLPVSIELTVWREICRALANASWLSPMDFRSASTRFFIEDTSLGRQGSFTMTV